MRADRTASSGGSARLRDASIAYAALRIAFGVNMAMHGVNRVLAGVGQFAAAMAQEFSATVLPRWMVLAFGQVLPFVELAIGILLLIGLWTRGTLLSGMAVIAALMFGTALKGDWNILGTQLLYALVYYLLLARRADDAFGVDTARRHPAPDVQL
jgi:thiosulfate dehydrogenase [quinone] large subunit